MSLLEMASFRPGGSESTFETYKNLSGLEKHICYRLVKGAGPIGWSEAILVRNAHIKLEDIRPLIDRRIVLERPIWQWAEFFVELDENKQRFEEMELGEWEDASDLDFFFLYQRAIVILANKEAPLNQLPHFQVRPDIYLYINLMP